MAENNPAPDGAVKVSGEQLETLVDELEKYLFDNGVKLNPSSVFRQLLQEARQFRAVHGTGGLPTGHTYESYHANALSAFVWASAVLRARGTPFEQDMKPRLRLLGKGDPAAIRAGRRSRERDLLFEVIAGCALSRTVGDVHLEEPDLVCAFNGQRWGVACKVAYGTEDQIADALSDGVRQVEESNVEAGIVVVDMTNVFPHERMVPRLAEDPSFPATLRMPQEAVDYAAYLISPVAEGIRRKVHLGDADVRKCQLAAFMGHSFCRIAGVPTSLPFFLGLPFTGRSQEREAMLLCRQLVNGLGA